MTTRNKYMRCEKLFYGYDVLRRRYLSVRATPGNVGLQEIAVPLVRQTLPRGQQEPKQKYEVWFPRSIAALRQKKAQA